MSVRFLSRARNLQGKTVLLRVDFNVPIENGKVKNDFKIQSTLPTIEYLQKKGARIVLFTHLGRPKGVKDPELSTKPIAKALSKIIGKTVFHIQASTGPRVQKKIRSLQDGDTLFLENIQFEPGECENDELLSKELASYGDIFVLDAFGQSHRAYASLVGIQSHIKSYAGLLLEKEIRSLEKVMIKPRTPYIAIIGGAKIETKIPVIEQLLPKADAVLIGGGLVNTYLKAVGYGVGSSLVDTEYMKEALTYGKKRKVVTPIDVVVGKLDGSSYCVVDIQKKPHKICKRTEGIFDIGPKTIALYGKKIKAAKTLVWNGAMGYFEQSPYHLGTYSIARLLAARSTGRAFGLSGGGETVEVIEALKLVESIDAISTGGGAMLEYLSGKELPAILALRNNKKTFK